MVPVQASAEPQPRPQRPYRAAPSRRSRTQGQEAAAVPLPHRECASPRSARWQAAGRWRGQSRFDYCTKIGCRGSPANTVTYFEKSGLIAGHEPPSLWAIIIWVIMIRWRSRRSHVQFARVERQDRSTLTRNSDKRSVIVYATPPLGRINSAGTSGHLKENQRRSDHECKGYFHWKSFRTRL